MNINPLLKNWQAEGEYIYYSPKQHKIFAKQLGDANAPAAKTLLLLHGFPESSFSYHAIVEGMLKTFDRIILFDMIGYGWSDKPTTNYSYSLLEQADTAFAVWRHFGAKGGHLLGHDMGDSVATEVVARHENGLLPAWFSDGLQSLTFTNGGMVLRFADLRITQKMLLSNYGKLFNKITNFKLFSQQVRSAHGNENLTEEAVSALWQGNLLQDGHQKTYLTIKYLNDRKQFEKTRWLPALSQTKLPVHICWGAADSVAPIAMARHLKSQVCPSAMLTVMEGLGHFCQLGSPSKWVAYVSAFYKI